MVAERLQISLDLVKELFDYREGALYWLTKTRYGQRAGSVNSTGRRQISISNKLYKEHRIIFLWHFGHMPHEIDHIDGNPLNNHIENLREATHSQNQANCGLRKDNTSGVKGVWWCARKQRWKSEVWFNGKKHNGSPAYSPDFEAAVQATVTLRAKLFGEFARHE